MTATLDDVTKEIHSLLAARPAVRRGTAPEEPEALAEGLSCAAGPGSGLAAPAMPAEPLMTSGLAG